MVHKENGFQMFFNVFVAIATEIQYKNGTVKPQSSDE